VRTPAKIFSFEVSFDVRRVSLGQRLALFMSLSLQEAQKFVNQFTKGEYTPEEHAAFLQWLTGATSEELAIISEMHESREEEWILPEGPSAAWVMRLEQKLNESEKPRRDDRVLFMNDQQPVILMRSNRKRVKVWAAAIIILLATGTYIYVQKMGSKLGKLADREKFLSMTFVNPRGGAQKEMVLADGSKVWLDAGSELKYPPKFTGSERFVELSGEAFFDVAGSSERPFRVRIKDAEVEVLGTFFTIMAYDDEPENRTAVVDGDLKVTTDRKSVIVKPGHVAEIVYAPDGAAGVPVVDSVNPNFVLAGKNGIYRFEATELSVVMREVARAYDVTIQYQSNVGNPQIGGNLDLNKSLETTLKQLESATESYQIHFNHKGKTVTVISSTI
jgi:ferric-dicitrate binding protein FerR (iron transport regulator)